MVGTAGYFQRSAEDYQKEENNYIYRIACVEAEIKELEEILKKFQWIFNK